MYTRYLAGETGTQTPITHSHVRLRLLSILIIKDEISLHQDAFVARCLRMKQGIENQVFSFQTQEFYNLTSKLRWFIQLREEILTNKPSLKLFNAGEFEKATIPELICQLSAN